MRPEFCLARAEECEWLAREATGVDLARQLRLMAADWRQAAAVNDDDPGGEPLEWTPPTE